VGSRLIVVAVIRRQLPIASNQLPSRYELTTREREGNEEIMTDYLKAMKKRLNCEDWALWDDLEPFVLFWAVDQIENKPVRYRNEPFMLVLCALLGAGVMACVAAAGTWLFGQPWLYDLLWN
jgi:hypothetical protein